MKVYLIRHAESEENALDLRSRVSRADFQAVLERSFHSPLTARGTQQVQATIQRLADAKIERLYTSPMLRAATTASILGQALGLAPVVVDDLREIMPTVRSGPGKVASLRRHWIGSYTKMLWPFSRHETWASAYRRSRRAWQAITAEPAQEVAAVAHYGTISMLLLALQRSGRWRVVQRDRSNGGISIVAAR
ncbi:histidine phosphatase family protein [Chloroflexia bacterium SDU3-3]|nr:histidine phosphatase family protein [Chloroflexia bacterium SDU3-3]